MKIYDYDVTFVEVPTEINLTFYVYGCKLNCKNCSWLFANTDSVYELSIEDYKDLLEKYKDKATCIVFLGGEWEENIIDYIKLAQKDYKICLYTGLTYNELLNQYPDIIQYLDYLKTGRYIERLGNLDSPTTNQQLLRLTDNKILKGKGFNK